MTDSYSVCQFFIDDSYEYVRRFVPIEDAIKAAIHYSTSLGVKLGTTVRVIITDDGDCIVWEWKTREGVVFPPEVAGQLKNI